MVDSATATERGPLMLMPTMAATDTVDSDTDTERGPLMPMPTTAAMVMAVMDTVDSDTATERGLLMLTMAVLATAMVLMATASNLTTNNIYSSRTKNLQISILDLNLPIGKSNSYHELKELKYTQFYIL